jgi:hypothetical protein
LAGTTVNSERPLNFPTPSRAAAAGVPLATLAAILGHNNLRSVIKYVHPSEAEQFRAIDQLEALPPAWELAQASQVQNQPRQTN